MPADSPASPPSGDGYSPETEPPARKTRFPRACTSRPPSMPKPKPSPAERRMQSRKEEEEGKKRGRVITTLVSEPSPAEVARWEIRSMWELASVLNFIHVFRPLLNIGVEFSAEEIETALISPNSILDDVHMPLLKAIPPVIHMALGRATWVTVLCKKLKNWWHLVADGDIPIIASHGAEVETYKTIDPATRVLILKALCDIRVEQDDIRNYIEGSLKNGIHLSEFRRERLGGDSYGISYWYEDDPVVGHRLYREVRRVEVKKLKEKGVLSFPLVSHQWETVATNLDEFQEVSEKLFSSENRTEAMLGKKLKIDLLPDIEKIHKRKDRLLKKQQRAALLLDSYLMEDALSSGRSLRDRKPVTYTFDDYDRSINEAIKITKKMQNSPENVVGREAAIKPEGSSNSKSNGQLPVADSYDEESPLLNDSEETDEKHTKPLDCSNRQRKRPQRYAGDLFKAVSDVEADVDSDDDIVGEAIYDDEYLQTRKQKTFSSGPDGDAEYLWEEENVEDDEDDEDDEDEEYSLSTSEDIEEQDQHKKLPTRSRRRTKLRSVGELQSDLRRSKRASRLRVNYQQYELSDTDTNSGKGEKSSESDATSGPDLSTLSQNPDQAGSEEMAGNKMNQADMEAVNKDVRQSVEMLDASDHEGDGVKRKFLDLNELAPGNGCDDGRPSATMKDEDMDKF